MLEPTAAEAASENIAARQGSGRVSRIVLLVAAIALLAMCCVRAVVSWRNDANMDHVVGVWTTMSQDLLHGVFYRPVFGPLGYGGTRWMPLFFVLHAGFWKALGSWRSAGHLISGTALVALLGGVYLLLRRLNVSRTLAFGAAVVALAGAGGKYALLDIRADGFAAALNLWGVIVMLGARDRDDVPARSQRFTYARIALAALLFTLAFATKLTTVFGVAAVFLWLIIERRRAVALWLAGTTALGYVLTLALTNHFSSGRFLQILHATASGGGTNVFALGAPIRFADEITTTAPDVVLLVFACAVLLAAGTRVWRTIPALFFAATLAVTVVIFGSPGTVGNHLIDLEVASAIAIAFCIGQRPAWRDLGALALAATMVVATLHYYQEYNDEDTEPVRQHYAAIENAVRTTGKPVLTENPIIAVEAGQRPCVLDPFMFRVFAVRDPKLAQPLWDKLDAKAFGAVVLEFDPRTTEGTFVYENVHFGPPFLQHLTANYEFVKQVGDLFVWQPKGAPLPSMESESD
jgi:hypothetical protein